MNTQSRNRSSITSSDISEMQLTQARRAIRVPYLSKCWGPLCFNPLLFGSFRLLFSSPIFVQTRSLFFCLCLVFFTLLLVFSNLNFPLVLDTAAPALPLSLAHCLCQMSWLLFFFSLSLPSFSSLTPSLPLLVSLSLSSFLYPKQLQETCSLVLCSSPLVEYRLFFYFVHSLHLPWSSRDDICFIIWCLCMCVCTSR